MQAYPRGYTPGCPIWPRCNTHGLLQGPSLGGCVSTIPFGKFLGWGDSAKFLSERLCVQQLLSNFVCFLLYLVFDADIMASCSSSSSSAMVTWRDVDSLDRGHGNLAIVVESSDSETETVDTDRLLVVGSNSFKYDCPDGCRVDHPKDKHLISFLKQFNLQGKWDLFLVRKAEHVILAG